MAEQEIGIFGFIGMVLAAFTSWMKWKSIFLAVVHGVLGWFYIIYYLYKYGIPKW